MKYVKKSKTLTFKSDEEVLKFHDQLTDALREMMSGIGNSETSEEEGLRLSKEFFERYSTLAEALSRLRTYLPQNPMA
ncbi:MAG: hypothetical protein A3K04_06605 [Gallionellales bacterium RBG_16_56_9]|nr:MAG: hypothetical protein A3K04_06605 [Gallionellales bacterium RBG_16_56_9]